jgi:glycosyltransferase involved in cell wall biosynthesis
VAEIWIVSNFPPPVHGVAAFNAALLGELAGRGIECRAFAIGTRGDLRNVARVGATKTIADAAAIARLGAALARARIAGRMPAAIYFTPCQGGAGVLRDLAIARVVRSFGGRLVAHIHGCAWLAIWERGGWQAQAMEAALRACDRTLCLGPTFAAKLSAATGVPCVGINNGVVSSRRDPGDIHAPEPHTRIELLFLSNLYRAKGLWIAAHATRALTRRGFDVRLRCAGAWLFDRERADFAAEFAGELAAGTIELVGFADELAKARLFASSHFFVLPIPGDVEGQPLALLEAMAHGVVPITTSAGGMVDIFPAAADLASSAHVDPERVAHRIAALCRDPQAYVDAARDVLAHQRAALTMKKCTDDVVRTLLT